MKYSKKIWLSGFWCVLGAVLIALSFAGVVDEFWNGINNTIFLTTATTIEFTALPRDVNAI